MSRHSPATAPGSTGSLFGNLTTRPLASLKCRYAFFRRGNSRSGHGRRNRLYRLHLLLQRPMALHRTISSTKPKAFRFRSRIFDLPRLRSPERYLRSTSIREGKIRAAVAHGIALLRGNAQRRQQRNHVVGLRFLQPTACVFIRGCVGSFNISLPLVVIVSLSIAPELFEQFCCLRHRSRWWQRYPIEFVHLLPHPN